MSRDCSTSRSIASPAAFKRQSCFVLLQNWDSVNAQVLNFGILLKRTRVENVSIVEDEGCWSPDMTRTKQSEKGQSCEFDFRCVDPKQHVWLPSSDMQRHWWRQAFHHSADHLKEAKSVLYSCWSQKKITWSLVMHPIWLTVHTFHKYDMPCFAHTLNLVVKKKSMEQTWTACCVFSRGRLPSCATAKQKLSYIQERMGHIHRRLRLNRTAPN